MTITRPRIACINWSKPDLPKAGVLVPVRHSEYPEDAYFDTWAEAVEWANGYARAWASRGGER